MLYFLRCFVAAFIVSFGITIFLSSQNLVDSQTITYPLILGTPFLCCVFWRRRKKAQINPKELPHTFLDPVFEIRDVFFKSLYTSFLGFFAALEKRLEASSQPSIMPQNRTEPREILKSTQYQENAAYTAKEPQITRSPEAQPVKKQGVAVGIAVDGENAGGELVLEPSLRVRHLYLIGKTRTGKTTLVKNLILQDIAAGHGLCFVDPHGDAAEDLIGSIPQHRIQDIIYFDPASDHAPAFNLFRLPYQPHKLTEDTISVLKMFFDSWGPRLEHLLRYSILTLLLDTKPRTLKDLRSLLVNADFRAEILANVEDESIREFWTSEFSSMGKDAALPITNKLSTFLLPGSPLLKLFSQPENDLDFTRVMNEQKILIVNLAKGILGEGPSRLLGGLIVTGIQQAALARAEIAPEKRKDFYLYLDEFQNFIVSSFESILSEAAKYKLYLTLAHQTLGQMPSYLQSAIFGNVATLIAFQVSAEDAATLRREMHRTRHMYRKSRTNEYLPLADLLEEVKQRYREHTIDGDIRGYQQEIEEYTAKLNDPNFWEQLAEHTAKEASTKRRIQRKAVELALAGNREYFEDKIQLSKRSIARKVQQDEEMLQRLSSSDLTPPVLKELSPLFTDYEFKQTTFPDTDDFINQKPRHAFCRRERAENVTVFRTLPAPDPSPQRKQVVLEEMRSRYAIRRQRQAEQEPLPKTSPELVELTREEEAASQPVPVLAPPPSEPYKPKFTFSLPANPEPTISKGPLPDPVQEALQRRTQKQTPPKKKLSSPARVPKNDDDFSF